MRRCENQEDRLARPRSHIRISKDVSRPGSRSCADGGTHWTATRFGIAPGDPNQIQVSSFISCVRDGTDGSSFVEFAVANPNHAKAADIDQDLTDGTQQFVFFGSTHE